MEPVGTSPGGGDGGGRPADALGRDVLGILRAARLPADALLTAGLRLRTENIQASPGADDGSGTGQSGAAGSAEDRGPGIPGREDGRRGGAGKPGVDADSGTARADEDVVATLVFDRPDKLNALPVALWRALPEILRELDSRRDVRALVLAGAGENFSSGSDIAELPADISEFWEVNATALDALDAVRVPTIAAVRGVGIGGGTELAAACDIRIGQPGARFGIPAARLGLVYPPGPTRALAELIGPGRARYLILTGEIIDAERALAFGLIDEIADDALARAMSLARRVAGLSDLSQQGAKRILAGEDIEALPLAAAFRSQLEGARRAFAVKERPVFDFRRQDWPG